MGIRSFLFGRPVDRSCYSCHELLPDLHVLGMQGKEPFGEYCSKECVPAIFRRKEITEFNRRRRESFVDRARKAGL